MTIDPIEAGNTPDPSAAGQAADNTGEPSFGSVIDGLLADDAGRSGDPVDSGNAAKPPGDGALPDESGTSPSEPGTDGAAADAAVLLASLLQVEAPQPAPSALSAVASLPSDPTGVAGGESDVPPPAAAIPANLQPDPTAPAEAPPQAGGDAAQVYRTTAPEVSSADASQPRPERAPGSPMLDPVDGEPPLEWAQPWEPADPAREAAAADIRKTTPSDTSIAPPDDGTPHQERDGSTRFAESNADPGKPAAAAGPALPGAGDPTTDVSPAPEPASPSHATPVQSVAPVPVRDPAAMLAAPAAVRAFAPPAADDEVVVPQLVRAMRLQMVGGVGEARLQLEPRHLGAVSVALRVQNGVVSAVVTAEQASVRHWIAAHETTLRQSLAEQGLLLDALHVERDGQSPFDRSAREHEEAPRRRAPRRDTATFELVA